LVLGDPKDCPLGALAAAPGKVKIKLWYDFTLQRGEEVLALVKSFNASQDKVEVEATFHGNDSLPAAEADDFVRAVNAGAGPDVVSTLGANTQLMIDSKTTVAMGSCVATDKADLSDMLPAVRATGMSGNTLVAMPWGPGGFVLMYNKAAFTKAGLDPNKPPSTLAEIRTASKAIMASGAAKHGMSMLAAGNYLKGFLETNGDPWLTSGRPDGRADHSNAGGATGTEVVTQLAEMVKSGELVGFPLGPTPDHLLAIASGDAAMTIAPAGQLGGVIKAIADGAAPGVVAGVGPMPSVNKPASASVEGSGAPLWIAKGTDAAKREAAYRFAKWLIEPQQMFEWASKTGSFPITKQGAALPAMQQFYVANPLFKVSYDQVLNAVPGPPTIARTGATELNGVFTDLLVDVLTHGADPAKGLAGAVTKADAALAAYNASVAT
jgi:sn-glycerol 3-phosphate transport system substrate-binding protein